MSSLVKRAASRLGELLPKAPPGTVGTAGFVKTVFGTESLWEAFKKGGLRSLIDGNTMQSVWLRCQGARLVGTDYQGNQYWEKPHADAGMNRIIIYKNVQEKGLAGGISGRQVDPDSLPPEWYNWLHFIQDEAPVGSTKPGKPIYLVQKEANLTGTDRAALPKGSWYNPSQRNWRKVQVWHPPGQGTGPETAPSHPSGNYMQQ